MADDRTIHALPAEIIRPEDPLLVSERVAVAAFLAGYSGGTCVSYTTDLRIFAGWCPDRDLNLLNVKRAHLELFARWMEQEGRMPSTIGRRLSTLSLFYKYCQIEDIVIKNPAANIGEEVGGGLMLELGAEADLVGDVADGEEAPFDEGVVGQVRDSHIEPSLLTAGW